MAEGPWYCTCQRAGPLVKECRAIRPRLARTDSREAVSYTHLDVYKRQGATYAQMLAHKAAVRKGLEQAARDATVQVQADTHTQRAMWLMVCSIADAYGFGPKQLQKFFTAPQALSLIHI